MSSISFFIWSTFHLYHFLHIKINRTDRTLCYSKWFLVNIDRVRVQTRKIKKWKFKVRGFVCTESSIQLRVLQDTHRRPIFPSWQPIILFLHNLSFSSLILRQHGGVAFIVNGVTRSLELIRKFSMHRRATNGQWYTRVPAIAQFPKVDKSLS